MVRRVVDADVAAERPAVSHLDVGHRRGDLGEDRPADLDLGRADDRRAASPSRRARASCRTPRSCGARPAPRGRRARRGAARCFITLRSVWPPASARAPSCSERSADRLVDRSPGARTTTSRSSMAPILSHRRGDMSSRNDRGSLAAWPGSTPSSSGRESTRSRRRALLARDGWSVCVLERDDRLGGAIRTERRLHAPRLHARGAELLAPALHRARPPTRSSARSSAGAASSTSTPTSPPATAFPDGSAMFLQTSLEANVAEFDRFAAGDGAAWQRQFEEFMANADLSFGVLGTELWSGAGLGLGAADAAPLRTAGAARVRRARALDLPRLDDEHVPRPTRRTACSRRGCCTRASAPTARSSGFMTQVIACAHPARRHAGAGRRRRPRSSTRSPGIVRDAGGELRTGADVERILVADGARDRCRARRRRDGRGRARASSRASRRRSSTAGCSRRRRCRPSVREAAARYRYGRAGMQIHIAMDEPPRWKGPDAERLARTAIVHVTPGLDGVSRAVNEAERGLLPAEATIVAGQPCARRSVACARGQVDRLDPAPGAPAGPREGRRRRRARRRRRDAGRRSCARRTPTGSSRGSASRSRTSARRRSKRVVALPRRPRGAQLQPRRRRHLRGQLRARPEPALASARARRPGTRTAVEGLWHVGASTHPGPGLGAGSGYLVAKELTKPPLPRRLLAKLPGRCVKLSLSAISTVERVVRGGRRRVRGGRASTRSGSGR